MKRGARNHVTEDSKRRGRPRWLASAIFALAAIGAAAKAAEAYWACVSTYDGCTYSMYCEEFDDQTGDPTGRDFFVTFSC